MTLTQSRFEHTRARQTSQDSDSESAFETIWLLEWPKLTDLITSVHQSAYYFPGFPSTNVWTCMS